MEKFYAPKPKVGKGPDTLWVHEHTFAEHNGGTLAGDNVLYSTLGGKLIQKLLIAPDLERIFRYRHQILQQLFNPRGKTPVEDN